MAHLDYALSGPAVGPPLLLGSSLGTTRAMWDPQAVLAQRWRVVAFDHRGHGGSDTPPAPYTIADLGHDVLGLLDRLAIRRFAYAGLSLGGMVGMWLAATVPDRVERLALLCTSACLGPPEYWHERARLVRSHGIPAIADAVVARWFTPSFAGAHPEVVARYRTMLLALPAEGYAACCEAIAAMDLREMLSAVTAPTLVIAGDRDEATPVSHAEEIVAHVKGAQLSVVPDAAHIANVEKPAAVTALLTGHLGGS